MDFDADKIDELLELTKENNKILRSMRSTQKWSSFFTFVYWAIILGSIFGTYYYFQPTINKYKKTIQKSMETLQSMEQTAGSFSTDINAALKNFNIPGL